MGAVSNKKASMAFVASGVWILDGSNILNSNHIFWRKLLFSRAG